ncbi:MAG: hypothetical protein QOE90_2367 [Thermoplasmata archaeon]|jgi:hypothetical protein|nr:hypothetical protein [Thermoplasmata archaeon]
MIPLVLERSVRALVLVTLVLLAGCLSASAPPEPAVKVVGATVSISDAGRTPVTATLAWQDKGGSVLRAEDIPLAPGAQAVRDFIPPGQGPYEAKVTIRETAPGLQSWTSTQTWDLAQCSRWQATFVYNDSISPVGMASHGACAT